MINFIIIFLQAIIALSRRTSSLNIKDIIIYLITPTISFVYGLLESTEKQKRYGNSNEGTVGISKTVGILMGPPVLV